LEALSRLFSPLLAQRRIRLEDFHVPVDRTAREVHAEQPRLWLEVDIEFREADSDAVHASVPPNFSHMAIQNADAVPQVRIRLTAVLAADGEIDEKIEYVLAVDEDEEPTSCADMSRYDRGHIEVHYLPARRDPADHISYTTASLIGRTLRAADWSTERDSLNDLMADVTVVLVGNAAVARIGTQLAEEWSGLHTGAFFADPSIAFGRGELEGVLRQLTVTFSPSHHDAPLPFERLSDGQKSLRTSRWCLPGRRWLGKYSPARSRR
jgi:putative ATP-dependent endonuclease of OLD family